MTGLYDLADDHREEDAAEWHWHDDDYREPDPEDYEIAKAEEEHSEQAHDGGPCDCPVPTQEEIAARRAEQDREHAASVHDGGECDCEPPFLRLRRSADGPHRPATEESTDR